ncbi:DUF397 domain-containing protein [Streptomyces caeni]|uniref:DUF397 domain-containing protein n=1 Tax=Streptomyces caeni TaxID=2307231 RepID=A0ABW4IRA9_9ACTN
MRAIDLSGAKWRSSSYSNTTGGDCVEVADDFPAAVPVRDSKNSAGPALVFEAGAWSTFVTAVRTGGFPA